MKEKSVWLSVLQLSAGVAALAGVVQLLLGLIRLLWVGALSQMHFAVAVLTMVASILAGAAALGFRRAFNANPNVVWLALLIAIASVAQYGLGEAGLRTVHMVIGILFAIGAAALAVAVYQKPYLSAEAPSE